MSAARNPLLLLPPLLPSLLVLLLSLLCDCCDCCNCCDCCCGCCCGGPELGPELGLGVVERRGRSASATGPRGGIGGVTGSFEPSSRRKKEGFLCSVRSW